MKGRTGCPANTVTVLPRQGEPAGLGTTELSAKARFRLGVFDRHRNRSPGFSKDGKPNAGLTRRHFGIHRPYFHRWDKRFGRRRLSTLEDRHAAPGKRREPSYPRGLARRVGEIRKANPTYPAKKIRPILLRTEAAVPGVATTGRLIAREGFFFRADARRRRKQSKCTTTTGRTSRSGS